MVGGSVGFEREKLYAYPLSDRVYTSLSLSPDIGYFLFTNLAVGIRPEFTYHRSKLEGVFEAYTMLLSPFIRFYMLPSSRRFNVFADASVFGSTTRGDSGDQSATYKSYGYTASAGTVFFISNQVGLEFGVGYWSEYDRRNRTEMSNRIKSKVGLQVHLGR